jgi:hypothetical protein
MEWLIPIQTFQVDKVQFGMFIDTAKPIIHLAYSEGDYHFPSLSLIFPLLMIKTYDPATGRLVLSLSDYPAILTKLTNFQESLISAVTQNHSKWFSSEIANPRVGFQSMIRGNEIHLYCPVNSDIQQTVPFYSKGSWSKKGIIKEELEPGKSIRIAIRIQGISFHIHPGSQMWSGKYRIQHKILGILV